MKVTFYIVILLALTSAVYLGYRGVQFVTDKNGGEGGVTACTTEAKVCPDGTVVGRTGEQCQFAECPPVVVESTEASGGITVEEPEQFDLVESPLTIRGEARGTWFFEATFPVKLLDKAENVIAEGYVTAGDPTSDSSERASWMTEDFVPFTGTIEFEAPEESAEGILMLEKANPSGLEENAGMMWVPVRFHDEELISI